MVVPDIKITGWLFHPYIFMVTGFCLLACQLLKCELRPVNTLLRWVGGMSLEVYLIHGQFIALTRYITNEYALSKPLVGAVLVPLSFLVAWGLHLAMNKIIKR